LNPTPSVTPPPRWGAGAGSLQESHPPRCSCSFWGAQRRTAPGLESSKKKTPTYDNFWLGGLDSKPPRTFFEKKNDKKSGGKVSRSCAVKMTPVCVHDRTYIDNVSAIFLRLYSKNTQNPLFPTKIHSRRILSPPCERQTDQGWLLNASLPPSLPPSLSPPLSPSLPLSLPPSLRTVSSMGRVRMGGGREKFY